MKNVEKMFAKIKNEIIPLLETTTEIEELGKMIVEEANKIKDANLGAILKNL